MSTSLMTAVGHGLFKINDQLYFGTPTLEWLSCSLKDVQGF